MGRIDRETETMELLDRMHRKTANCWSTTFVSRALTDWSSFSHSYSMQLVRVRSKEGTHRIEVNPTDDITVLRNKVWERNAFKCSRELMCPSTEMRRTALRKKAIHGSMLTLLCLALMCRLDCRRAQDYRPFHHYCQRSTQCGSHTHG